MELQHLSQKMSFTIQPAFRSTKLCELVCQPNKEEPLVSGACCVYQYTWTCDKRYFIYTAQHLHEQVNEHWRSTSTIAKHCTGTGHQFNAQRFSIITKGTSKFDLQAQESIELYF